MGCDIHPFIDYDVKTSYGSYTRTFAKLDGGRDYLLFGLLTNGMVRVSDAYIPEVGNPVGLPERMGYESLRNGTLFITDTISDYEKGYCTPENAQKYLKYGCELVSQNREGVLQVVAPSKSGGTLTIPKDFSRITHPDWHNYSYVDADQLAAVIKAYPRIGKNVWGGNATEYSPDVEVYGWLGAMRALNKKPTVENVRLVYWFDN